MDDNAAPTAGNGSDRVQFEVWATLGPEGRMITLSKTHYAELRPDHVTIFNANVLVAGIKRWHGDLDVTRDECLLIELARRTGETVSVLYELDARFATEARPLLHRAVYTATPDGSTRFSERRMMRRSDGTLVWRRRSN